MGGELTITTWNVNSIRARLDHVTEYLAEHEPDIVCLQESKVEDALFPKVPFLELGYHVTIHGGRALAGVATLTKSKPDETNSGFLTDPPDKHPRILNVLVDGVRVYNLYVPNGTSLGSAAFEYKLAWLERLREEIVSNYSPDEAIAVVGDFNIALEDRDLYDPERLRDQMLFTEDEKSRLRALLEFGFTDCFRKFESGGDHFTWFDYRTQGFERNQGFRIDHIYATDSLAARCVGVTHDMKPRGWDTPSDHVPVTGRFTR